MFEKDRKMCAVFVDLRRLIYNKVCREELWEALQTYSLSGRLRVDGEIGLR